MAWLWGLKNKLETKIFKIFLETDFGIFEISIADVKYCAQS